ncbi:hypothetical protein OPV22_021888 [Ensete ventricosum]|uniref:Uncharacterized protein n=1 Tax=Ensete ventricosum TaxID=4639 RepID=A0AAV8PBD3_ENSVE|nr:hypothetical protein OPV22_021888 [Ensete ventricosum]
MHFLSKCPLQRVGDWNRGSRSYASSAADYGLNLPRIKEDEETFRSLDPYLQGALRSLIDNSFGPRDLSWKEDL